MTYAAIFLWGVLVGLAWWPLWFFVTWKHASRDRRPW